MNVNIVKSALRRIADRLGYLITRKDRLPYGYDVMYDVGRLSQAWNRRIEVVFDVGANTGQTVNRVIRLFPNARIFAFEPSVATFSELARNTANLPRVVTSDAALGAEEGIADFYTYEYAQTNSLIPNAAHAVRYRPSTNKTTVRVTTLDNYCRTAGVSRISLLKIDTEGFELPVLEGAQQLFAARAIDFVYVEFNYVLPRVGASGGALAPICEYLSKYDLHFVASYTEWLDPGADMFLVSNALFVRRT